MKRAIKRLFLSCAAVMAVTAVCTISASAEATWRTETGADMTVTVNESNNSLTVTPKSDKPVSGQTTIVVAEKTDNVIPEDDDIVYMNQDSADTADFFKTDGVLLKESGDPDHPLVFDQSKKYVVYVADETHNAIYQAVLAYTDVSDIMYGDVNDDKSIDASDAVMVINYFLGKAEFTDQQRVVANVNNDTNVDASDAVSIVNRFLGKIDKFPVEQ